MYNIYSNQRGLHPRLQLVLKKNQSTQFQKPISVRSYRAWKEVERLPQGQPIILDSGCGRGMSSYKLASLYPSHTILAVDQSSHRMTQLSSQKPNNIITLTSDCVDIWRLCAQNNLNITHHYLLYPNPWPKKKHLQRRFYAHPVFPVLISLADTTIVRSNWLPYILEFSTSCYNFGKHARVRKLSTTIDPWTHFETKYQKHGQALYQLTI